MKFFHLSPRARLLVLLFFVITMASTILLKAASIQIIGDSKLKKLVNNQFQKTVLLSPKRGEIQDRNGVKLAVNVEVNSLAANPQKIKSKLTVAMNISKATSIPYKIIYNKLKSKGHFVWVARQIPSMTTDVLKKAGLIKQSGGLIEGLWLLKENKRVYPQGSLASHILGDVNIDSEGIEGIELWKNSHLRGKKVSVKAASDALGRPISLKDLQPEGFEEGKPLKLTIDSTLQHSIEGILTEYIKITRSQSGTVIVMNAENGDILAMANNPTFNPNTAAAPSSWRRNRAITDGYEPGSTMKPILVASALSNGFKITDKIYGENGEWIVQNKKITEAEKDEKFKWITLAELIQVSSNIGAGKLAIKLGKNKIHKTLVDFGFGNKTGLGFPGEINGIIPSSNIKWKPLRLATLGFGQGILVTPIQMIRAYAVFANGGKLVEPNLVFNPKKKNIKQILDLKVTSTITKALTGVTTETGTGFKAALTGYEIAGKTGTAQVVDPKTKRYSTSRYISSFIGFSHNTPEKLIILTLLDYPRGIYYASETTAPLFREVFQTVVNRYSMPPTTGEENINVVTSKKLELNDLAQFAKNKANEDSIITSQSHGSSNESQNDSSLIQETQSEFDGDSDINNTINKSKNKEAGSSGFFMPQLKGLSAREAIRFFEGQNVSIQVIGTGFVEKQNPNPGIKLETGVKIRLELTK